MDKAVCISLLGQKLYIKSDENENAVRETAAFLESEIEEIRQSSEVVDSMRVLLYTAFKIADDNLRLKSRLSNLEQEVETSSSRMLEIIE